MARSETKIYLGHYSIELEHLSREVARAELTAGQEQQQPTGGARRLGEASPLAEARAALERVQAEADAAGDYVVIRPLLADEWEDLVDAHPPRTEGPDAARDATVGFNAKTGRRALVLAGLVEPKLATLDELNRWVTEHQLTRGELEGISIAIWEQTNRAPFVLA